MPKTISLRDFMTAFINPERSYLTSLEYIYPIEILCFQIALPNCGTHLSNPQIYSRSSNDEIPPAIITF